jgi:SAM-dependent methyltransferase
MSESRVQALDRRWYPDVRDNWDDELLREWVLARLTPRSSVLDLGAGAGIVTQMNFREHAARVCGVDLDPRVAENPYLHEAKVAGGEGIPYGNAEFDLVFSDNVLEHLDEPARVFAEVARVLKPGGYFLAKTPNRWHYMPIIARLTPHAFHRFYNRLRGRASVDTFPTRYRANSISQLRKLAAATGFEITRIELVESRPEYLRMNALTYCAGRLYERFVNSSPRFRSLRILLVAEFRKLPGTMP